MDVGPTRAIRLPFPMIGPSQADPPVLWTRSRPSSVQPGAIARGSHHNEASRRARLSIVIPSAIAGYQASTSWRGPFGDHPERPAHRPEPALGPPHQSAGQLALRPERRAAIQSATNCQ
jgi:hypothetical protein